MIHRVAAAVSGVLATAALTLLVASYPLTAFGVAIVPTRSLWVYAVAERGQLRLLLLEPVASLTRTMPRERAWYIDSNEFYCYTRTRLAPANRFRLSGRRRRITRSIAWSSSDRAPVSR